MFDEDATLVDNLEIDSGDQLEDFALSPASTHASDLLDKPQSIEDAQSIEDVVYSMLDVLDNSPFNFMDVLLGIFYGSKTLRTDLRTKRCRASVFTSDCLYLLLRNMVYPPRTKAKGTRAKGAKHAFDSLVKDIVVDELRTELDEFGQTVYARKTSNGSGYSNSLGDSPGDSFIIAMLDGLERHAPKLMQLLTAISEPERQRTPSVRADRRVSTHIYAHICIQILLRLLFLSYVNLRFDENIATATCRSFWPCSSRPRPHLSKSLIY
jgi:hypothetical protein